MIPCLLLTYNRLEYTKEALSALMNAPGGKIYIIDNGSTDATVEWIKSQPWRISWTCLFNKNNLGIAGAMNQFLDLTYGSKYVAKVDNDTVIPNDFFKRMVLHMQHADIVQAKHHLIKASGVGTFDEWTSKMPAVGALRLNHFVGGSGIMFKRAIVDHIPETDWALGGWRQWQREHPEVRKAFATDVEIRLLDTDENGATYPAEYEGYYKETKRI